MLFYEPLFLFVFFPTLYLLYLLAERRALARFLVLLCGSVLFYFWVEPLFVPVVLASALADHLIGRRIAGLPQHSRQARTLLAAGVIANVAILAHFKYTRFLLENAYYALHGAAAPAPSLPAIALPVGVSFIVFEKITYLVDIHRRVSRPAPGFATYLLYVFFFPKLLAGPIIKYHELESQLVKLPAARWDDISTGFVRFMMGVAKKTLLADTLALGADRIFAADPYAVGFHDAWLGVLLFALQIYFDFSAYSDMAIGIARMLGLGLRENFNMPYLSCSITEFWRRWHISLATWIREYLYIPLGGNRVPVGRRYLNLWVCFLASGLWHGAAWPYVAWGAYNGLFLVLDKLFLLRVLDRMPRIVANLVTFFVVVVGWTIFRAKSLGQAGALLGAMSQPSRAGHAVGVFITPDISLAAIAAAIICACPRLPGFDWARRAAFATPGRTAAVQTAIALVFVLAVGKAVADPFQPFLYFRF
jgi:alginate O-acetyltransferase complex protein AlgI